jgi:hypothetical protein
MYFKKEKKTEKRGDALDKLAAQAEKRKADKAKKEAE